ncbi:N-acetylmuramoyl-L-alanine amidase [Candidatus Micrarchaeota archaeon]|nr:N-acetylmuramoyl-L-alanine amidase [Candidatus Micrarchaeota archaeon]
MIFNAKSIAVAIIAVMLVSGCASQGPYLKLDSSLQKDIRTFDGANYLPLTRLCDVYGVKYSLDPYTNVAKIEKGGTIVMRAGSERILVDGVERKLDRPVMMSGGTIFVPASFVRNNLGSIVQITARPSVPVITEEYPRVSAPGAHTIRTVILDPGHGGRDPGAIGKTLCLREKDLVIKISKRVKNILEEHGMRVIMTRADDTFIPLAGRVSMTNKSDADIFVSIHINAAKSRSMAGFECYYLSEATDDNALALEAAENESVDADTGTVAEHSKGLDKTLWDMTLTENRRESVELASRICSAVGSSRTMTSRGIRSARFYVLKGSRIPAVLVEAGYISNRYEESKFNSPGYADKVADAVAQGILSYKNEYERTHGFTI